MMDPTKSFENADMHLSNSPIIRYRGSPKVGANLLAAEAAFSLSNSSANAMFPMIPTLSSPVITKESPIGTASSRHEQSQVEAETLYTKVTEQEDSQAPSFLDHDSAFPIHKDPLFAIPEDTTIEDPPVSCDGLENILCSDLTTSAKESNASNATEKRIYFPDPRESQKVLKMNEENISQDASPTAHTLQEETSEDEGTDRHVKLPMQGRESQVQHKRSKNKAKHTFDFNAIFAA